MRAVDRDKDTERKKRKEKMELLKPNPVNSSPLTPLTFLERAATVYGECASVIYNDTTYTWSQTHRRCLQLASSLVSLGIKPGDVVSVVAPNVPAMYELHFGVPMSGAIFNTINTRLDPRTISIILRHSESKLVFVDYQSRSLVLNALSLFPLESQTNLPILIFITEDDEPTSPAIDPDITYERLVTKGDPEFNWVRPESEWNPMILNYTSGTTSSPKGVVHCHRTLYIMAVDSLTNWSVPNQPVYLWTLPMFHANGWTYTWSMASIGGTNICLRRFDAQTIYAQIRRHGVTHMCGAPVVLNMLAHEAGSDPLSKPVQIFTGGAPPPASVLLKAESLGFIVSHGYGLTETAGVVVSCTWKREWDQLPASERARLKARQGVRTTAVTEVDVIDGKSGHRVKRDGSTMGEIVLRGPCIMLGYLKDPIQTFKCIKNGWFYTGDMGVMHLDGYLEIKDRSKDVIITGGENLSSVEVESILYSHPSVNEAAVVARPDEFWGESPCAFLSLKYDSKKPSEREIMEFCRAQMPHFMVPKTIVFMDELPKTSTGEIKKFLLKDRATAMGAKPVSRM